MTEEDGSLDEAEIPDVGEDDLTEILGESQCGWDCGQQQIVGDTQNAGKSDI